MSFRKISVLLVAVLLLAYGCSTPAAPVSDNLDPDNTAVPTLTPYPAPGKPVVTPYPASDSNSPYPAAGENAVGLKVTLLSADGSKPVANSAVSLIAAAGASHNELPQDLNVSPAASGSTDGNGVLTLKNISAGNYFLVVKVGSGLVAAQSAADNPAPYLIQVTSTGVFASNTLFVKVK